MTDEEKIAFYEKLIRRIVVHADSFGDVHYMIRQAHDERPELKEDKPWFN